MTRIMFVCHGNICRSPMAEFIFKNMLHEQNLTDRFTVASCATSTEEIYNGIGNPIYPPAAAELKRNGIPFDHRRAVQLQKSDYPNYDLFICMDSNNVRNMLPILGGDPDRKIRKLMDYTPRGGDVTDPWYSRRFDVAYQDICDGCRALIQHLLER